MADNVLVPVKETKIKPRKPTNYGVLMKNDDYTPMDFVELVISRIFNKSSDQAHSLMMDIHTKGSVVVEPYSCDVAETKADEVLALARNAGHPFLAQAIPLSP